MPGGALAVTFTLEADLDRLRIPARRPPRFADRLWQHTCFEVFLARKGARAYREYNLAPSGQWAAYAFSSYRKRIPAEPPFAGSRIRRADGALAVSTRIRAKGMLRIGLAAVIEEKSGALSYWALRHPPGRPDFHHRRSFALELA
jgi:hypothetical protein